VTEAVDQFFSDHPIVAVFLCGLVLMLSGVLDRWARFRIGASFNGWLGGLLAVLAISCGTVVEGEFLGMFRWPVAVLLLGAGLSPRKS
jgi:uncharacterized membrane protein HdeD (DUF308 family)